MTATTLLKPMMTFTVRDIGSLFIRCTLCRKSFGEIIVCGNGKEIFGLFTEPKAERTTR